MAKKSGNSNVAYETPSGMCHNAAFQAGREVTYFGPPPAVGSKQRYEKGPDMKVSATGLLKKFSSTKGGKS